MEDLDVYTAMQSGKPYSQYKKTILGQVHIIILNPFSKEPESKILFGQAGEKDTVVTFWTMEEDVFFKRMNQVHLSKGVMVGQTLKVDPIPSTEGIIEQYTDEEVIKLVHGTYFTLKGILGKTVSEAFLNRVLDAAQAEERSVKIIGLIETRLAEVQNAKLMEK